MLRGISELHLNMLSSRLDASSWHTSKFQESSIGQQSHLKERISYFKSPQHILTVARLDKDSEVTVPDIRKSIDASLSLGINPIGSAREKGLHLQLLQKSSLPSFYHPLSMF
jgi:hypothetical protein